jgi:hypothetical protein
METGKIVIQQTQSNALVEVDPGKQSVVIKGNSFIADPRSFYATCVDWARDYKVDKATLKIEITPGYYSTSNLQIFNAFLKTLGANNPGKIDLVFCVEAGEEEDMEETIYSLTFNTGIESRIVNL